MNYKAEQPCDKWFDKGQAEHWGSNLNGTGRVPGGDGIRGRPKRGGSRERGIGNQGLQMAGCI